MSKKVEVFTLPGRFPVVVNGEIVDAGKTPFQAAEIAKRYGAKEAEVKSWTSGLQLHTSQSRATSRGSSRPAKKTAK